MEDFDIVIVSSDLFDKIDEATASQLKASKKPTIALLDPQDSVPESLQWASFIYRPVSPPSIISRLAILTHPNR